MKDKVFCKRKFETRADFGRGYRQRFIVTAELSALGDQAPYFSITGDLKSRNGRTVACGCMHDDAAEHFPKLRPFIRWHLTSTAAPMHYEANAIYHAGLTEYRGKRNVEHLKSTIIFGAVEGDDSFDIEGIGAHLPVYDELKPRVDVLRARIEANARAIKQISATETADAALSARLADSRLGLEDDTKKAKAELQEATDAILAERRAETEKLTTFLRARFEGLRAAFCAAMCELFGDEYTAAESDINTWTEAARLPRLVASLARLDTALTGADQMEVKRNAVAQAEGLDARAFFNLNRPYVLTNRAGRICYINALHKLVLTGAAGNLADVRAREAWCASYNDVPGLKEEVLRRVADVTRSH